MNALTSQRSIKNSLIISFFISLLVGAHPFALAGEHDGHDHSHHHDHGMSADAGSGPKQSVAKYVIPQVSMVKDDGTKVAFPAEIDDGRPVILHFIYTSCTAICPVTSQVVAEVQKLLGKEAAKIHFVSISIDPEYDTPARLKEFAGKYNAGPQWNHYTGTADASIQLQKAFDAYRGDKMNHTPLMLLRAEPGKQWVRLDGLVNPSQLLAAYRGLNPAKKQAAK